MEDSDKEYSNKEDGDYEEEDEESETEDDEYSDDDSFVTSDEEEHGCECADCPAALVRCDAGIPELDNDTVTSNKEDAT